ncbi:hypothetical protein RchiOBHm_Chr6g0258061 [Rosa chinensis]|uniref:Uncharacterized protein n=1 Tax=Rosa chinensis TaxID=74649 RepID=A0A2P6PMK8_ROSCH|nr:hypothetical protein RchiOBHm_Chr6g0258061 [Rosa chinensis]
MSRTSLNFSFFVVPAPLQIEFTVTSQSEGMEVNNTKALMCSSNLTSTDASCSIISPTIPTCWRTDIPLPIFKVNSRLIKYNC